MHRLSTKRPLGRFFDLESALNPLATTDFQPIRSNESLTFSFSTLVYKPLETASSMRPRVGRQRESVHTQAETGLQTVSNALGPNEFAKRLKRAAPGLQSP